MVQLYIGTIIITGCLFLAAFTYYRNDINRFLDKVSLFKELVGIDDKPINPLKFMLMIFCPALNFVTTIFFSFILFSSYKSFEKAVKWMSSTNN